MDPLNMSAIHELLMRISVACIIDVSVMMVSKVRTAPLVVCRYALSVALLAQIPHRRGVLSAYHVLRSLRVGLEIVFFHTLEINESMRKCSALQNVADASDLHHLTALIVQRIHKRISLEHVSVLTHGQVKIAALRSTLHSVTRYALRAKVFP